MGKYVAAYASSSYCMMISLGIVKEFELEKKTNI